MKKLHEETRKHIDEKIEETKKQNEEIGKRLVEKLDEKIELMRRGLRGHIHQVGTCLLYTSRCV